MNLNRLFIVNNWLILNNNGLYINNMSKEPVEIFFGIVGAVGTDLDNVSNILSKHLRSEFYIAYDKIELIIRSNRRL